MAAKILDPITIRNVTLHNRVVLAPHGAAHSRDVFSEASIAYYEARARGGCALAITESTTVQESHIDTLYNTSDRVIPGFQAMMKAIRPHGMRMFQQIYHRGHNVFQPGRRPPFSPSGIPSPTLNVVPRPLHEEEIEEILDLFVAAARRCREGGLDGVEIHGAHGYLIHQFLSPLVNQRDDCWGGSLENRMRFLQEVLRRVRSAVAAPDFIVGVRLSCSDAPGSLKEDELRQVIGALEAEGLIDYLSASFGDYYHLDTMNGAMHAPAGYTLPSAARLTEGVAVPRMVAGRFRTLEEAQQVMNEGVADMIGMCRAQIADPELVRKTREGRADQVRPCIACNQGCVAGLLRDRWMQCAVNPAVGFEAHLDEQKLVPAAEPRKILIVGGGPAGMEAARVSALQGHKVILAEASSQLGGAANAAKRAPKMQTIGDIVDWQEREIFRLGVEVRLGTYMDVDDVLAEGADKVIVATGSLPRMDGVQFGNPGEPATGAHLPHVISSLDLFLGPPRELGATALVVDDVGHGEGLGVAEELVNRGLAVTFVTRWGGVGLVIEATNRPRETLERLYAHDFSLFVYHYLTDIRPGECDVRPLMTRKRRTLSADTVVLVTPNLPLRDLFDSLRGRHPDVELVGDALAPRDIQYAITDGHRAARPPAPLLKGA